MIGLIVFGVLLLAGAWKLLRGMYFIRKARRLNAASDALEAETAATKARTAALEEQAEAEKAAAVVALGFVGEADLDTEHGQPVLPGQQAALAAVRAGDWEAGADWIAAAGKDWEERWSRVRDLAEAAAEDDAWLLAWKAARPGDPTAALVDADTAVLVAWNVRGSQSGARTTQEQFRLFHDLLLTARRTAQEAQEVADPADPVPYMVEQPIAMGLGYPHEQYEELWAQITERAPKLLCAHTSALQYWAAKWRGSHELALGFARTAADGAEPGELLSLLPLIAHFENEAWVKELRAEEYYKEPEVVAAVDAALADLAAAAPDDRRAVRLRHMLAWMLFWQDRDAEAVEQFRHIDGYIGAVPWSYAGRPKQRYLYARDWAVRVTLQSQ
ncbi:hypothetical protein ABZ924_00385 [Streptomyces sp. NPDC046876]|uniref:hypothetical protein n=1 Tax=Streptomyces sp. NPDC046876 TaxID=3155616 RepID=UPI0033F8478F